MYLFLSSVSNALYVISGFLLIIMILSKKENQDINVIESNGKTQTSSNEKKYDLIISILSIIFFSSIIIGHMWYAII